MAGRSRERIAERVRPGRIRVAAPTWVDRAVAFVSPEAGLRRLRARTLFEAAGQFRGADKTRLRADWVITHDEATPGGWELQTLRERARDLNRNDPVAAGATDTLGFNIVGRGLQMQARPRAEVLGVAPDRAREIARSAELIWQTWCSQADAASRLDFDEIQFLALRKIVEDGETIALPIMITDEPWRKVKRAIELVEADRLEAADRLETVPATIIGLRRGGDSGIEVGERGQPIAYWIRVADYKVKDKGKRHVRIAARDAQGRPKVLHVFRTSRVGQLRGIPFFAPVLAHFKDLADYMEAEVVAARVAACLAVFVTKNDPAFAQYGAATDTETSTGHRLQTIEPGLVSYLDPGEGINVVDPKRPGDSFEPFVQGVLRMIGMALNLPYELLAKDFSKTNYSSARAALLEARRMFTTWRSWFARKFCQPVYELVMEEAVLRGLIDLPKFYEQREEYCRALWIGGGWGWVDPVKEVEASRKAIDYGLSTLAEEAAGQGRDWEEVLEQLQREEQKAGELGVRISRAGGQGQGNKAPAQQPEEDENAEAEEK